VTTKTATNRERLNNALTALDPKSELASELRYWQNDVGCEDENGNPRTPDLAECFDNVESIATDNAKDDPSAKAIALRCRYLLIALGYYREMPQDEIARTEVSSGTRWAFKSKGTAYTMDDSFSVWLSK